MNLKEASRRLGVHYQTAYKWVRSGSLTAIRVGSRYEVSQSAIDQFVANRRCVLMEAETVETPTRRITDLDLEDVFEELEVMATDPVMDVRSISAFAARRGAVALGDLCMVVVANHDGIHAQHAAVDHPTPAHAAFVSALLATTGRRTHRGPQIAVDAFVRGKPVLIPHVSQDRLRASTRPEMRQYLAEYPIYSLLAAPILKQGSPAGFIAFSRDTADRPYRPEDLEFAMGMGTRIGPLLTSACEITTAWRLRNALVAILEDRVAGSEPDHVPTSAELSEWIGRDPSVQSDLATAVFDPEGVALFVSEAEPRSFDAPNGLRVGQRFDVRTGAEDTELERAAFAKLVSGELDFLDSHSTQYCSDGSASAFVTHRAAIRHPNAALACIVSIARPLHHDDN